MALWQIQKKKMTISYILIRCTSDFSYWKRPVQWEFFCQHHTENLGQNNERIFEETL